MHAVLSFRNILLSILYVILIIPFAILLHYGLLAFCDFVVFKVLTWFNELSTFWKFVLIFLGGSAVITWLFSIFSAIGSLLSHFIFPRFPRNYFTIGVAVILFLLNVVMVVRAIWLAFPRWNFLFVLEFLILAYCVICAIIVLLPIHDKD